MLNSQLLSKIILLQNCGSLFVKWLGIILMNPLSAGIFTAYLLKFWGGSWWYMWLPAYIILAILYFIGANLLIGVTIQVLSLIYYNRISKGEEKEIALKLIKKDG